MKQFKLKWLIWIVGGIFLIGIYWYLANHLSNPIAKGKIAFRSKQYNKAFKFLSEHELDPNFDDTCMAYLGYMYRRGEGTLRDNFDAVKWLRKGADRKNVYAMSQLGTMCLLGKGTTQNFGDAYRYLKFAAEESDADALYYLGSLHLTDALGAKNEGLAFRYFLDGQKLLDLKSTFKLADLYYTGSGVPQDFKKAFDWGLISAELGDAKAQYFLSGLYLEGKGVEKDTVEALKWLEAAARQKLPNAYLTLARGYKKGKLVKQSLDDALSAYENAFNAAQTQVDEFSGENMVDIKAMGQALLEAGVILRSQQKYDLAISKYVRAIKFEQPKAYTELGIMYVKGEGIPKNLETAHTYYGQAAQAGDPQGQCLFGVSYLSGEGTQQNFVEGAKWIQKSAKQNFPPAQELTGQFFEKGLGVPQQLDSAVYWYGLAALQGNENAKKSLARLKGVKQVLSPPTLPTPSSQPLKLYPPQEGITRFFNPSTQKWGFQNQQGQPIGEAYDRADDFKDGKAIVWLQTGTGKSGKPIGRFFTIDKTGKCISNC